MIDILVGLFTTYPLLMFAMILLGSFLLTDYWMRVFYS